MLHPGTHPLILPGANAVSATDPLLPASGIFFSGAERANFQNNDFGAPSTEHHRPLTFANIPTQLWIMPGINAPGTGSEWTSACGVFWHGGERLTGTWRRLDRGVLPKMVRYLARRRFQ